MGEMYIIKKVYQYTTNGVFYAEHDNISQAAKSVNASKQAVSLCVRGINKTAKGYMFSFEKHDRIPALESARRQKLTPNFLTKKKSVDYQDLGVIDIPGHPYAGKRKVKIGNKLEIYMKPDKDVQAVVDKYANAMPI